MKSNQKPDDVMPAMAYVWLAFYVLAISHSLFSIRAVPTVTATQDDVVIIL